MSTVADTQEASSVQGVDMAEREPREGTMLGGGSARASMVPGRMQHRLTHLDLFSGIGGFALATEWAERVKSRVTPRRAKSRRVRQARSMELSHWISQAALRTELETV